MRTTTHNSAKQTSAGLHIPDIGKVAMLLWRRYTSAVRRRATERALAGLSDQTLRDIGLHRSEISSAARQVTDDRYPRRR